MKLKGKIISEIEALNGAYTKSEEKIKSYLLSDLLNVIHLSVTELAEEIGVGETTIVRFCKKLGYKGYQDFKLAIAQDDTIRKRDEKISERLSDMVYHNLLAVLEDTLHLMDQNLINESIRLISESKYVYFIGIGSSGITAIEAYGKFFRLSPKFHYFTDSHFQMMAAQIMTEDDLLIVFSLSGSTKEIVDTVKEAKKKGCRVIAITNFKKSPITKYSDIVLLSSFKGDSLSGGTFAEKISQLYILDVLFMEYLATDQQLEENRNKTAMAVTSKKY